jgi:Flp pilus assembly pilin Flp
MLLLSQFWSDDTGSVIATEYLILAGIVSAGAVVGLGAVRDATKRQADEFAQQVISINQSYNVPAQSACGAVKAGSQFVHPVNATP